MKRFLLLFSLFTFLPGYAQVYERNVKLVIEALASDSLSKAEKLIQQTIQLDPERESNAVLYQYLGEIYQRGGQNSQALDAYTKGIALVKPQPAAAKHPISLAGLLLGRASLHLMMNNPERALLDYDKLLATDPDNEEALFFRAFIFSGQRRNREARTDYDHLLKVNPMHEDARLGLAILNSKDGRPREAMEQLDALIQLYPTHARHYLARCGLYEQRREYERAIQDVERAIECEPDNPECYLTRASLYLAMKKKRLAGQDCRTAISLGASGSHVASILEKTR